MGVAFLTRSQANPFMEFYVGGKHSLNILDLEKLLEATSLQKLGFKLFAATALWEIGSQNFVAATPLQAHPFDPFHGHTAAANRLGRHVFATTFCATGHHSHIEAHKFRFSLV